MNDYDMYGYGPQPGEGGSPYDKVMDTEELENSVLTAAMQFGGDTAKEIASGLRAEMFVHNRNDLVFDTVKSLVDEGKGVDAQTVKSRLTELPDEKKDGLDVLGNAFLKAYSGAYPLNWRDHMETLRARWGCRAALEAEDGLRGRLLACGSVSESAQMLEEAAATLRRIDEGLAGPGTTFRDAIVEARALANNPRPRASTGVWSLDAALEGGLEPGEMLTVGAATGVGKSALGALVAKSAARAGVPSVYFSMEMTAAQIGRRLLASTPGLSMGTANRPDDALTEDESKAVDYALRKEAYGKVHFSTATSLSQMLAESTRRLAREGKGLVVVDYLQLTDRPAGYRGTETEFLGEVTRALKLFALREEVAVVLLSQLNRLSANEGRRPRKTDLRGSGCIEQDSDMILLLSRVDDDGSRGFGGQRRILFDLAKNRRGDETEFELIFDPEHMQFQQVADDSVEAYSRDYDSQR